ncbi:MAG: beta-ketoacyl synthase N-terminal-like domain-containing protein [Myxococcota bacterium]|nr:beta-ketoacyl synthase N-terminal-like domain-containing protein [Myxococcota bacterium]
MRASVTGVGVLCALGDDLESVQQALAAGRSALQPLGEPGWEELLGARVPGPKLKGLLKRRKDAKLLPRAAKLALPVAFQALGQIEDPEDVGLFAGVRREPPDRGEADAAIAASLDAQGRLDTRLLAERGRDLYPPLLPLMTLPNMVLAHVAINLELMGPGDAVVGAESAGVQALRLAIHAIEEGRCQTALVLVADSQIDGASLRDRGRLGLRGPVGEAAIALKLEPAGHPESLLELEDRGAGSQGAPTIGPFAHRELMGSCELVDPLLGLLLGDGHATGVESSGAWARVVGSPPSQSRAL